MPDRITTDSGIPVKTSYDNRDVSSGMVRSLGKPGEFPYARGIYPSMYRDRLWTMRQYTGFGSASETKHPSQSPPQAFSRHLRRLLPLADLSHPDCPPPRGLHSISWRTALCRYLGLCVNCSLKHQSQCLDGENLSLR